VIPYEESLLHLKANVLDVPDVFQRITLQSKQARFVTLVERPDPAVRKDDSWGSRRYQLEKSLIVKDTEVPNM
jgi:hypothetical protein